ALTAEIDVVGADYLRTMGVQLLQGRWFRADEMSESGDSAIIDQRVAARLWPGENTLGKPICVDCTPEAPKNWKRVVGVVTSINHVALDDAVEGNVYLAAGAMRSAVFLVVRTQRPPSEMENAIRLAIARLDPNQPVLLSVTMRELIADSIADRRFILTLLGIMSALALAMSSAGVFGVVSYTTTRRTQEIGIRMALGAKPQNVLAMVFGHSFFVVSIGLLCGLVAGSIALRVLGSVLAGLQSSRPAPVVVEPILVAIAAALACWIPARRATRIDPMQALRHE
ncbi:MAG: FtsX-like permease family protein, partial [Acidobacteriaceae bacterium]|nr:FtsX-like permease family protein [Acidobacteriaceae bacterium]